MSISIIHRAVHLRLACFTIYMTYFNETVKVAWKRDRGRIWSNIWVVIPGVPKPMGKSSLYFVRHTYSRPRGTFLSIWGSEKRVIQQCRYHCLQTRAPSLSVAAAPSLFSVFSAAPSLWSPNGVLLPADVTAAECKD